MTNEEFKRKPFVYKYYSTKYTFLRTVVNHLDPFEINPGFQDPDEYNSPIDSYSSVINEILPYFIDKKELKEFELKLRIPFISFASSYSINTHKLNRLIEILTGIKKNHLTNNKEDHLCEEEYLLFASLTEFNPLKVSKMDSPVSTYIGFSTIIHKTYGNFIRVDFPTFMYKALSIFQLLSKKANGEIKEDSFLAFLEALKVFSTELFEVEKLVNQYNSYEKGKRAQ